MNQSVKRIVGYLLVLIVLMFTVLGILGVWGVIDLEDIGQKVISSLLIVFAASAVLLFIFSVVLRDDVNNRPGPGPTI
jgi:hypothetical protein